MASANFLFGTGLDSVVSFDFDSSWAAKSVDTALYYHDKAEKVLLYLLSYRLFV